MDDECEDPVVQEYHCLGDTATDLHHGDDDGDDWAEEANPERHSRILGHLGQSIG